jgi:hypothetical protein
MKSFWLNGYRQDGCAPDAHNWKGAESRRSGFQRWGNRDDRPGLLCVGSGEQLSSEFLMAQSGPQLSPPNSPTKKETRSFVFLIEFRDLRATQPAVSAGKVAHSIVVRIEAEEVLFTLNAAEPKRATTTFAEALAQHTAFLVIEKDFPNGVEPSLSTRQIEHLPAELENRPPDLYVNGNSAWLA